MATQELMMTPAEYSDQQVDLIRRTVAAGCSQDELMLFLEVCRGTGLNPFMKQIYAIQRRQKEGDQWVNKMTIQTGIDGYRLLAARTGALAGIDDAVFDSEDEARPGWASVTVWRFVQGHRVPFTAKARWSEYAALNKDGNPSGLWGKMPYLMLAKCAEALALRKAFPAELSGVYTAEEMAQADNPVSLPYVEQATPTQPAQPHAQPASQDRYAAALGHKEIIDLLVARQRFTDPDRRAELASVFAAIEADGQLVNGKTVKAELQRRLIDLSEQDMGAPGN